MMARSIEMLEMYDRYSQQNKRKGFFKPSKPVFELFPKAESAINSTALKSTTRPDVLKYTPSGDNDAGKDSAENAPANVPAEAVKDRSVMERPVTDRPVTDRPVTRSTVTLSTVNETTFSTPFRDSRSSRSQPQWKTAEAVAFTGHRPEKLPWGTDENSPAALLYKFRLREALEYMIGRGYTTFLSGAARGFDTMAAEIVLSLREAYPWIRLVIVLPCADQAKNWSEEDKARWENIVLHSDHVETLQQSYTRSCMFQRNRYLVDHSSSILACFNGDQHSGTATTVNYAHKKKVRVRRLRLEKKV